MLTTWIDRFGAVISAACGVHCAGLGALILFWPGLWLQRMRYPEAFTWLWRIEIALAALALLLAVLALGLGWRQHRQFWPALFGVPGLAMIGFGVFSKMHFVPLWGSVIVLAGGLLLVAAHLTNMRMLRIRTIRPTTR